MKNTDRTDAMDAAYVAARLEMFGGDRGAMEADDAAYEAHARLNGDDGIAYGAYGTPAR